MNTGAVIAIIVVVVVIVLLAVLLARRRRTDRLQEQFGPEYQRTVSRTGDRRSAESELAARAERRKQFDVVALEPAARDAYRQEWRTTQARFVDDPSGATREADGLVSRVMRDRGYPVEDDFDQQADVVSVDHPQVAENYRAAHALFQANEQGLAGTDDLRQAFVHYRSLFDQLLDTGGDETTHQRVNGEPRLDGDDRKEAHQ
jgi:hypothetical protein